MLYTVIPAGGSGTRLWPLSRSGHPKFLQPLTGTPASLLQATVTRLAPLSPPEQTFVVTGAAHAAAVARQLPELPDENILVEPGPRDSCPAIAFAAAVIARRDPQAVMGSFAADHLIVDEGGFRDVVRIAIEGAQSGYLMTIGITPTHPETGYGYIQVGETAGPPGVVSVTRFQEKPDRSLAEQYVASGEYLWNAGMFVWRVDAFLAELARQRPEIHAAALAIAEGWDTDPDSVLEQHWPKMPKVPVDTAVMEGAAEFGRVATVPGDFGWSDIGDFHSLGELLKADESGNVVLDVATAESTGRHESGHAEVVLRDTENSIVIPGGGRIVTVLGGRDLVVVDTEDALLVCARSQAQQVKGIVEELRERGHGAHI